MLEMDIGLLYAIAAYISCLIIGMVLNRTLATKYKEAIDRPFATVLAFFIAFCFIDGSWGLFFSTKVFTEYGFYGSGYELFTYGFHAMSALSAFFWSGYMVKYVHIKDKPRKFLFAVRLLLLLAQWGILISNVWNHKAFYFVDAIYKTGPWRKSLFWIQFSYYILITIIVVLLRILKNDERKKAYKTAILFSAIPLLAGVFQLLYPDAPMYSLGFLISTVVIYAFNVTESREEYLAKYFLDENSKLSSVISGLSEDFLYIYTVDMDTNEYENYGNGNYFAKHVLDNQFEGNDFFENRVADMKRVIHPDDYAMVEQMISKDHIAFELKSKKSFNFNYRVMNGDEIQYNMIKVIRSDSAGEGNKVIIGVFDDDERVRKEMAQQEQLRIARTQAEQASKAKTNFLFNMSHDIRTPMNAILGFTDMTEKNLDNPEKSKEYLGKVRNAGNHLLSIINDVLDMSRIESGKVTLENKPMSLKKNSENIIDIVAGLAKEKNVELIHEGETPKHDMVYGDEMHYNRICMNIITNAIKYTEAGGKVFFGIVESPCDEAGYSLFKLTVRDTGIGMSEEYLTHIFETFSRERTSTVSGIQGTGLGMAITKSLVDLMGRKIAIESTKGIGSKVTIDFKFKLAEGASVEESGIASAAGADILRGKKVLLVEDNALNREIAVDMLSEYGMTVYEADDGTVAVDKCRKILSGDSKERYDIILMDIQMPIMDGYTATQEIRKLENDYFRKIPILAMTANVFAEDVEKSKEAGMNAHLGKPVDVKELIKALTEYTAK